MSLAGHEEWNWLDVLPNAALVFDRAGVIARANQRAAAFFGYPAEDLPGQSVDFLVPQYLLPTSSTFRGWLDAGPGSEAGGINLDLLASRNDGTVTPVEVFLGPAACGADGHVLALVRDSPKQPSEAERGEAMMRGLLADIGRIIGSSLDFQSVCEQFAMAMMRSLPAERVAICLVAPGADSYELAYVSGPRSGDAMGGTTVQMAGSPVGIVVETRTPLLLFRFELEELGLRNPHLAAQVEQGLSSIACVPLIESDRCIGALVLSSYRDGAFTTDDLELLDEIAHQVAGAISSMSLHAELRREASEREALANIGRLACSSPDFEDTMDAFVRELGRLVSADRVSITIVKPGDEARLGTVRHCRGVSIPRRAEGDEVNLDRTPDGRVVSRRQPVIVDATNFDDLVAAFPDIEQDLSSGLRSCITVPLISKNGVIGTLNVASRLDGAYSHRDISLVARVGDQVAGAVHTAILYQARQREADIRRALADIGVAAGRDLDLQHVFERVADDLAGLFKYDRVSLSLLDPDGITLRLAYVRGVAIPGAEPGTELCRPSLDAWPWERILEGTCGESGWGDMVRPTGLESRIEVPFGTEAGGPAGYLSLRSFERHAYDETDLDLLGLVATQVTPAIQNAMAHAQALRLAQLQADATELERVSKAKSEFLSTVSHELRTPLTSISAFADILAKNKGGTLTEKQEQHIAAVQRNAQKLGRLVFDLLDISRIEAGTMTLVTSIFDMRDLLDEIAESITPVLARKRQCLEVAVGDGDQVICGDREKITQVFSNLLENASKYSPEGRTIYLEAESDQAGVTIAVRDSGHGISRADQARLFTPFFRSENVLTRAEPGTGLGLAIVKSITEMHGGRISVESEEGNGSAFIVRLPRVDFSVEAAA
ncbi:MAG: GAF domain-containing protein [Dehalococcoidia bacterium]